MMKTLISIILSALTFGTIAQEINFLEAFKVEGSNITNVTKIDSDENGNIYVSGRFSGYIICDFINQDDTLSNLAVSSFIIKYNSSYEYQWAASFPFTTTYMDVANDGTSYMCGTYIGTVDFDPGEGVEERTSNGYADIAVVKLNSDGSLAWVNALGSDQFDVPRCVRVDALNNVYICGAFKSTLDVNPGDDEEIVNGSVNYGGFVQKYATEGDLIWSKDIGSYEWSSSFRHMDFNAEGDLYITGYVGGITDIDFSVNEELIGEEGTNSTFVIQYDTDGNLISSKGIIGSNFTYGRRLQITPDGDVLLACAANGILSLNNGNDTIYSHDFGTILGTLLVKISNEEFTWGASWTNSGISVEPEDMLFINNSIYVVGSFKDTLNIFTPQGEEVIIAPSAENNALTLKFNQDGELLTDYYYGTEAMAVSNTIIKTSNNNLLIGGQFSNMVDFDISDEEHILGSGETPSIFLLILNDEDITDGIDSRTIPELLVYPNPTTDYLLIDSENITCLKMYTLEGSLVMESNSNKLNYFNLRGINPGMYIVVINMEGINKSIKIILE